MIIDYQTRPIYTCNPSETTQKLEEQQKKRKTLPCVSIYFCFLTIRPKPEKREKSEKLNETQLINKEVGFNLKVLHYLLCLCQGKFHDSHLKQAIIPMLLSYTKKNILRKKWESLLTISSSIFLKNYMICLMTFSPSQ